jgi:hypothetical protein
MVYLSPILALILPIMVMENTSFGYAFNRSFVLIKENWWANIWRHVVTWIIFSVCRAIFVCLPLLSYCYYAIHNIKGGSQQFR